MEKLISNFDIQESFWDSNPNMRLIKEFNEVYENEKKGRQGKRQGMLMWGIAMLIDRHQDNPYRNLPFNDRLQIINEDFLSREGIVLVSTNPLIDVYKKYCLSPIERSLFQIERKLEERDELISNLVYNLDDASQIDNLILNTKKLKDLYKEMKSELEQEQQDAGQTRGGRQESASEKRLI